MNASGFQNNCKQLFLKVIQAYILFKIFSNIQNRTIFLYEYGIIIYYQYHRLHISYNFGCTPANFAKSLPSFSGIS